MKHIRAIVSILIMLLVIILIVENLEEISKTLTLKVDLLFWSHETPPMAFYLVMIIVFLLGIFIAAFFGIYERFRLKREIRTLLREKAAHEREVSSSKNIPAHEEKRQYLEQEQEEEIMT
jgi:uncharacterized integral membrane protein